MIFFAIIQASDLRLQTCIVIKCKVSENGIREFLKITSVKESLSSLNLTKFLNFNNRYRQKMLLKVAARLRKFFMWLTCIVYDTIISQNLLKVSIG